MNGAKLPLNVFSNQQAEKLLGINLKQKKVNSVDISHFNMEFPSIINHAKVSRTDTVVLARQAILRAITVPYLKAVIAVLFSPDKTVMQIAQVKQKPLTKSEILGALITCYEQVKKTTSQKVIFGFKEKKETHMIAGSEFSQFLTEEMNNMDNAEILIINVHHDYIDAYTNVTDVDSILKIFLEVEGVNYGNFK